MAGVWRIFALVISFAAAIVIPTTVSAQQAGATLVRVNRLLDRPIITPQLDASIGPNIQGPSLIRVPVWAPNRLGKYYLYFADHKGKYIRLAYADSLLGPWRIHVPGSLQLADSYLLTKPPDGPVEELAKLRAAPQPANFSNDPFTEATTPHIASPDVHVDEPNRRIITYYHGLNALGEQVTRAATSADGVHFTARPEILGLTYFRRFQHDGYIVCDGDAGAVLPIEGSTDWLRRRAAVVQPEHAPCGSAQTWKHAICVLDTGGPRTRNNPAEHH